MGSIQATTDNAIMTHIPGRLICKHVVNDQHHHSVGMGPSS